MDDDETTATPSRDPLVGRVLDGRYELLDVIGSGGMSTVYRAHDARLGRDVAVKVLHSQFASDPDFVERFRQEAEFAAGLSAHPNIVSIFDVGEDGDLHYIVMELIEGRNLKDLIRAEAPLSVERTFAIGQGIASALAFAHQRGLIHRDIKPQNILVASDGSVKVTDFGIARSASASQMTRTGVVMGTAHYIAPEQAQGQPSTAATDIYSLGVVLFEMLTGKLLFDADNPLGVAMKHVHEAPPSPSRVNPAVPTAASAVVIRALAKDPAERYRSASEFGLAMQRRDPGETGQVTTVQPIVGPASRAQDTVVVGRRPPPPGPPAPPGGADATPPNPWRTTLLVLGGLLLIAALAGGGFALANALGSGHARPTPTPTATKVPTVKPTKAPTSTPSPSPTKPPAPTPTPSPTTPPPPTPTPTPTQPQPTPTPLPTPTPAATPTPTTSG